MRLLPMMMAIASLALASGCSTTAPDTRPGPDAERLVLQRVNLLLDRYCRNDQAGVIAMLDPEHFTMLGTSFDEKVSTQSELRTFMDRDFAQWQTASCTDVRDTDVRVGRDLATAILVVTFQAGSGPTLPIRLNTTWRKVDGEWMLTQSSTALPPQG
ncbi:MAG TPA: nuclear transport factor 2 family protein [Steroidobacteraceae bacterium]|nr:nuclear transport factor 2 family protein [Steroidobacteraceae bacterium]